MPSPTPGPWHAEAVRWVQDGVSSDEAADRWGIEPKAARARLLRAAKRARIEIAERERRSDAECRRTQEIVERILLAGGGTPEVADFFGVTRCRATPWVFRARKKLGLQATKGPKSRLRATHYEPPTTPSEPREGGRWVSLAEAREVCA